MAMRDFDGKLYRLWGKYRTKQEANKEARKIRREGNLARITPKSGGEYHVWRRNLKHWWER